MKKLLAVGAVLVCVFLISGCTLIPRMMGLQKVTDEEMTLNLEFGETEGVYTGQIKKDVPNGKGRFTTNYDYGFNWTYEGDWKDGHFSGEGTTTWDDGYALMGEYVNDQLNGEGEESLDDSLIYKGTFRDNEYNGYGTLYNAHGYMIYAGEFAEGYYQESLADRQARLEWIKLSAKELTYPEIIDNAQKESGQEVKITGKILKIYPPSEDKPCFFDFLLAVNGDEAQQVLVFYRLNDGEDLMKENQEVNVWGTVEFMYTYTSEDGKELTVPNIEAWSVEAK